MYLTLLTLMLMLMLVVVARLMLFSGAAWGGFTRPRARTRADTHKLTLLKPSHPDPTLTHAQVLHQLLRVREVNLRTAL